MLYYNRINTNEGIDLAKSNNSKECMICLYWFFNHGFEFQDYVYNGCHDLTMLCLNISDITILTVKNVDYSCIIHNISKSESANLSKNFVLEDRVYILKILPKISVYLRQFFLLFLFSIFKTVDIMDFYKSLNISIGIVMKNP